MGPLADSRSNMQSRVPPHANPLAHAGEGEERQRADLSSQGSPHPGPLPHAGEGEERLTPPEKQRHIRSFVLRQGRFTPAQQRAFTEHWPRYGLTIEAGALDAQRTFGRRAPLVLEIGFGNGEQLLWSTEHEPDKDFIGIEVHRPGVGRLMNALASRNVDNVRLYN